MTPGSGSGGSVAARPRVVIVGGGVIGVCSAYYLAARGAQVTVVERAEIGAGASSGNAGTIAPGHPPINKPGRVRQALTSLFDPLSPLYVAPRWDPALARWLTVFAVHCSHRSVEAALRVLAPLGHETRRLFDQLIDGEEIDCAFRRDGYYEVYRSHRGLEAAVAESTRVESHGLKTECLTPAELQRREPSLRDGVSGGIHYRDGASLDPARFLHELAERAGRMGVDVRPGVHVTAVSVRHQAVQGVETEHGESISADAVLLATGAYSLNLLRDLGIRLPIQAGKGYHRDRTVGSGGTPPLSITCLLGETSVFCTPLDGTVRYAGTMEFSGVNHELRPRRLAQLTAAADRYLDGVGEVEAESEWCGLRPCSPDGLPVMGPVPDIRGLYVATGHAMLGLTLGPVTGKLMAEYVLDGRPTIDIEALSPGRF